MIIQITGCHDVELVTHDGQEATIAAPETLLPYLPGIVRLHGLGRVTGHTVELDENWEGWRSHDGTKPHTAAIVTLKAQ